MNGRKYIPNLDDYDSGEQPTLSALDEWDREESEAETCGESDETF
ncbi:hypothetical protein [Streptomyces spectabilis]|nr:hypothetical protein [Streptomyces spectabilis]